MQRIMNNPDDIVDEMLAGFVKCHSDIVKLVKTGEENPRGVVAAVDAPIADKDRRVPVQQRPVWRAGALDLRGPPGGGKDRSAGMDL